MDAISIRTILGILLASVAMTGCSSPGKTRPSCPVGDGVRCMSTLDVYEATNSADHVSPSTQGKNAPTSSDTPTTLGETWGTRIDGDTLALTAVPNQPAYAGRTETYSTAATQEPYREPAKVMRIYVSAWEDEQGDLHTPGFIFSEIEARRWSVGQPAIDTSSTFRLLEGLGQEAAKDSRAAAGATAEAGRPVRNTGINPN